jgi:hypothetical protein
MANYSLDRFRAEVLSGAGLARTNRFEVSINVPLGMDYGDGELVNLYCEQTNFPMLNINTKAFKIFGPSYQRPMSSEYGGEGLSMTFHVDREMRIKKFFEDWMHMIVNKNTFAVSYQEKYVTTINIKQIDEQDNVTHEIELLEAFPRNMNMMELNNSSSNQTHRLNMLFAYRLWRDPRTVNAEPIQRTLFNPEVPRDYEEDSGLRNVTYTGEYSPGTTNNDMAFGVGQLSG